MKGGGAGPETGLVNHIGRLVREERLKRYSIEELARVSGVSSGLISQIERGIGNPSIGNLWKIAEALELPLGRFFLSGEEPDLVSGLVRAAERPTLPVSDQAAVYEILTPPDFPIQMIYGTIEPSFDNSESPFAHPGNEVIHVLTGVLQVMVGRRKYRLTAGDTLSFHASEPHWYRTIGGEVTTLGAVNPPHVSVSEVHRLTSGSD